MISRRHFLAASAATGFASFAAGALAAEQRGFDASAFEAAQKAGRPILVEVSAPWCPTCQAQKPILQGLFSRPELENLVVFEVDFDTRKEVLKALNVRQQSTLIVFRGATEMGRSVGDTNPASIAALLGKLA